MYKPENTNPVKNRYVAIDALRGLAIAGIFLTHSISKFNFPSVYVEQIPILFSLDSLIQKSTHFLLSGKMFGIFSFLFGYTFQLQNANRRGIAKFRIVWRMLLLLVFGLFNSLFIPMNDILVFYSLIGILIIPIFFFRTSLLFVIAIFLLLQPFELYRVFTSFNNLEFTSSTALFTGLEMEIKQVLGTGDFWRIMKANLMKGVPASLLWDFHSGRITGIPGLFIFGILAARTRLFCSEIFGGKFWMKLSILFGILIITIWFLKKFALRNSEPSVFHSNLSFTFTLWINSLTTLLIISAFTFFYYVNRGRIFHPLSYLGKMSLTNYIGQSVLGSLIFASYSLNLANSIGITYSFLLTIILIFGQIILSRAWLRKHQKGPLETLWFSLTWIDKKLFKKE